MGFRAATTVKRILLAGLWEGERLAMAMCTPVGMLTAVVGTRPMATVNSSCGAQGCWVLDSRKWRLVLCWIHRLHLVDPVLHHLPYTHPKYQLWATLRHALPPQRGPVTLPKQPQPHQPKPVSKAWMSKCAYVVFGMWFAYRYSLLCWCDVIYPTWCPDIYLCIYLHALVRGAEGLQLSKPIVQSCCVKPVMLPSFHSMIWFHRK